MYNIAICDDHLSSLVQTASIVKRWCDDQGIPITLNTYKNAETLLRQNKSTPFDIIIFDIFLPLLNGMDASYLVRETNPLAKIIFLSSTPEFALESYKVNASGYLLKPVTYPQLSALLENTFDSIKKDKDSILIRTKNGYQKIYIHQIEFLEAQNKKVLFQLTNGATYLGVDRFSSYVDLLSHREGFFHCHRSYLVNFLNVSSFDHDKVFTPSNTPIPIARGTRNLFKQSYFSYMFA